MTRRIITILMILILVAGLSLLLYPTVSDYLQTLMHRRVIAAYVHDVEEIDDSEYEEMIAAARAYNEMLGKRGGSLLYNDEANKERYESTLDVTGIGVMGYIQIAKIGISLPIYHYANDGVLQVGVGHLEGSSLPIGGETCHTLLSAHRGLPSARLFTDLDQMEVGDTFILRVLRDVYTYEIDDISVIEPTDLDRLQMVPGMDYCTLITCTPYGVNSHRMLVRGHRIETPVEEELPSIPKAPEEDLWLWIFVPGVTAGVMGLSILIVVLRRRRARNS